MAKDVKSAQLCFIENVLTAEEGFTALRLVCQFGRPNIVALFLKSGVGSHTLTKLCGLFHVYQGYLLQQDCMY